MTSSERKPWKPVAVKALLVWTLFGSCIDGSKGKNVL